MRDEPDLLTLDRVVRVIVSLLVLIGVFALMRHLADVLLPFAAAVVFAYLLNPLVSAFERKMGRRGLAVAVTIMGIALVALAATAIMVPVIAGQARRFQRDLSKLREDLAMSAQAAGGMTETGAQAQQEAETTDEVEDAPGTALGWKELREGWAEYRNKASMLSRAERLALLRERLRGTYLGQLIDHTVRYTQTEEFNRLVVSAAKGVAVGGWTVVTFVLNFILGLTGLIIVLLYLVFLLLDYPEYSRTWQTFLPPRYRGAIVEFLEQFDAAMRRYFRGQAVVALLTGVCFIIGFTLIGLPMAVPFGLFVGLLNIVPYLQAVALVPAGMLAGLRALEGDSGFATCLVLTLLVFVVVQVIQDAVLTPRIMGDATGLKPVAILLGVFIWGKLLGFLGLVLAIPLTCLGIAYYRRYVLTHQPARPASASP